jgi:hypothetical protein
MFLITKYLTMLMPPLQGKLNQNKFFIFAAADPIYFDTHARPLIKSIQVNTPDLGCHIHIYNPRPDQIEFCNQPNVSCTYEYLDDHEFNMVTDHWSKPSMFENDRQRQMFKKGQTLGSTELNKLIRQTYYACARFVRLAEILPREQRCLAIDVDGLVRAPFANDLGPLDFYLYEKPKDGTHLAGSILFNGTGRSNDFIQQYAQRLRTSIEQNDIYWFLDQIILDQIIPGYKKGLLPMSYIDWAMRPESSIWSAKGKRKELDIFKEEQRKYS